MPYTTQETCPVIKSMGWGGCGSYACGRVILCGTIERQLMRWSKKQFHTVSVPCTPAGIKDLSESEDKQKKKIDANKAVMITTITQPQP